MKMKTTLMAALVAAQLTAAAGPTQAAELPREESAGPQASLAEGVKLDLDDRQSEAVAAAAAPAPLHAAAAQEQEEQPRKKRKSTGDKVLTGAAIVLGIGALAVGGLLVAIFAS